MTGEGGVVKHFHGYGGAFFLGTKDPVDWLAHDKALNDAGSGRIVAEGGHHLILRPIPFDKPCIDKVSGSILIEYADGIAGIEVIQGVWHLDRVDHLGGEWIPVRTEVHTVILHFTVKGKP